MEKLLTVMQMRNLASVIRVGFRETLGKFTTVAH